jgi:multiple sugar transport system permease protein
MRRARTFKLGNYLYITPALAIIAFVMLVPLCYTLFISFFKVDIHTNNLTFIGIDNFKALFSDNIFLLAIKNTLLWTVGSVTFQFLIGFALANILNMDSIKGKTGIRIALMVPWVLPGVVSALVWQWMYHSDFGIINEVLKQLGIIQQSISWTSSSDTALISAIIINVWKMVPFVILMTEAALQNVSNELKQAARIDGANSFKVFKHVTLPSISPTINTVILLLTIWTMNAFTFIYILTEGGPAHQTEILSLYIYRTYFKGYNMGRASAAATVLFVITAIAALLYNKFVIGRNKAE